MTRNNALREAVEANVPVVGARCETKLPMMIEVYGELGLDFAWVDFEHGGPSPEDATVLEELTRAGDAANIELLVRLPHVDQSLIRKVLDAGVRTILLPRVETAAEVEEAVRAARFWYNGEPGDRGVGSGRANTWGALGDNYVGREDASVLVGVMLENREALANIHEILSVPDLGFVFIGPSDLSVSYGQHLELDNPVVESAVDEFVDACQEHNVPIGGILSDPDATASYVNQGYRVLRLDGEIGITRRVLDEYVSTVRSVIRDESAG